MDANITQLDDADDRIAGDLLIGAARIREFLVHLGMPERSADPYYLRRTGRGWPIFNSAGEGGKGFLIASKRRLIRHVERLTRGSTAA
jgi:hypothetical protein